MRCFFCQEIPETGECLSLDRREEKHLFRTLRARTGETLELMNGTGIFAVGRIQEDRTILVESRKEFAEPGVKIVLFVSPPKKAAMDQMLKQLAEVGVWAVQPILTERSVSTPEKASTLERWKVLLTEGCKQAKNPFVPKIEMPISFKSGVEQALSMNAESYFGATDSETLKKKSTDGGAETVLAWFVGPEGGFTGAEQDFMLENNFNKLAIGRCIMRVETAAVVGVSILDYMHSPENN